MGERIQAPFGQDRAVPVDSADQDAYRAAMNWLAGSVHELPAGVLWGSDGASTDQCREMLDGLEDFARLCARFGLEDHHEFVDECRWHFEHYPHFLERRRHFRSYEQYVMDRCGPLRVELPPQRW